MDDEQHMRAALALARRSLGDTWPNPSVGCVLVANGRVVGRGVTAVGGRPHAEVRALEQAGTLARGATAYVTLEPCCHWGGTPPCTDALIAAGIARVVVGAGDRDHRVNGAGVRRLRAAGVSVTEGVLRSEAEAVVAGFTQRVVLGRPLVTLKLASTLDGRIATSRGESKWITGEAARRAAHGLRAKSDAVLVGIGTTLADDPALTCRLPGAKRLPMVRVVADSHLRIRLTSTVVATANEHPTWVLHRDGADRDRSRALADLGVRLFEVAGDGVGVAPAAALAVLGAAGITRLLVEGGAQLAASLLRADLVDRLVWFHAPSVMGGDGWPAAAAFAIEALGRMPRFTRTACQPVGEDMMSEFVRVREGTG
jgi:diaminohydroxyphosphoribosylaminopyrimidine deaminase / 5-amino-6-(5-phosphoribosylamino)uracil reductase